MGAYMSQPDVTKHSEDVFYSNLEIGVSGMQGWRMSMEDAHCCLPNFDEKGTSMFGVFDGHGGKEVADYCAENMHRFLLDCEAYQEGDIKKALKDTFLNIDEAITTDEVIKELKELGGHDGLDEEEDEAALLLEEANMPLGDLLERLKNSAQEQLDSETGEGKVENFEEKNKEKQTNGDMKHLENGTCEVTNPPRSRKQKKPVKRSTDEIQTDISVPSAEKADDENLSIKGVGLNIPSAASSSSGHSTSAGSSSSVSALVNGVLDDNDDDPEYQVGGDDNDEEEDEESYDEGEDSDEDDDLDDDDDDDDDDEFEDSDGVDFQAGPDEVGKDSGTTAIVSIIQGDKLYVANVGDSRCVLCRNGQSIELSTDHKPEDADELSRIEKAGAKVTDDGRVNGGLNLSRALGDHVYKQNKSLLPEDQAITANPEIREMDLSKGDQFMILACDGIWNVMTSEEVIQFVKGKFSAESDEKVSLSKICEELLDLCLAPDTKNDDSGCDNMTCMIIRFKHDDVTSTVSTESSEKRTTNTPEENPSKSKKLKLSED